MLVHNNEHSVLLTSERYDLFCTMEFDTFEQDGWRVWGNLGQVSIHQYRTKFKDKAHAIDAAQGWLSMMELAISTAHLCNYKDVVRDLT